MRGIRIINGGLQTTIQDGGRFGYRRFGIPPGGVMDRYSYSLANWLVANEQDEAVLEITLLGPGIEFLSPATIAITGASLNPHLNGIRISEWEAVRVVKGDLLEFRSPERGTRAYLAISGGFDIEEQMGSRSTYLPVALGGINGKPLKRDDIIPLYPGNPFASKDRKVPKDMIPWYSDETELTVVRGVDYALFTQESTENFFSAAYEVSPDSNRMGYRLKGRMVSTVEDANILSYPIHYGTIQVPGDGHPIIMGADCQTIGGYPQFVNVATVSLHKLGQVKPGDRITFRLTDHEDALRQLRSLEKNMESLIGRRHNIVCTDCIKYKH